MKYEVRKRIYKISQDHETHEAIFYVYVHPEIVHKLDRNLKHEELYEMLIQDIHNYQNRMRGEV